MSDIPEWAVKRATDLTSEAMRDGSWLPIGGHASAAFARYISEHEEPPVDPLLIEAREIVKATLTPDRHKRCNCREEIDRGEWDGRQKVRASLAALKRGIELGKGTE